MKVLCQLMSDFSFIHIGVLVSDGVFILKEIKLEILKYNVIFKRPAFYVLHY